MSDKRAKSVIYSERVEAYKRAINATSSHAMPEQNAFSFHATLIREKFSDNTPPPLSCK